MRNYVGLTLAMACAGLISACGLFSSDEPDLRDDRTAVVPGNDTANLDSAQARRAVLLEAAHITIDHGYQYFVVVHRQIWTPSGSVVAGTDTAIRPGDDVTIKVFHDSEVSPGTRDVFDAQRLLSEGVTDASGFAPASPYLAPAQPTGSTSGARCTAYGCSW